MSSTTRTEHLSKVTTLAHRLVDIAADQPTHEVAMEALISAYAAVAVCHPCCMQKAADMARRVGDVIEAQAALARASHVH